MSGKESRILWIEDLAGLIGGVQMNVLEFHVWGSLRQQPDLPHRMVFDIDPDEGLSFGEVRRRPLDIRGVLEALGLQSLAAAVWRQGHPCGRAARPGGELG